MHDVRPWFLARGLLVAAAVMCLASSSPVAGAAGAGAQITGPIAAASPGDPSRDYPFYASAIDLKARGYSEEEFFIAGAANRYETPAEATGRAIDGGHPYKTRLVVRRPVSAARFNGTVIVEWNNVTAGHDLDIDWFQTYDHLLRSGYAWIGVTPQRIGVGALKVWNEKRYGTLDVTVGGTVNDDALSFDIFAAVGDAVRHPGSVDLMGGLKVERIVATGHSQSAARLATYVNSVHPLAPVFDAVIVHGGGGRIRSDLDVKVWKLLSETDVILNQAANRQPDSRTFRAWEVAGDSHVDLQFVTYSRQLSRRDGSPISPGFAPGLGGRGAPSGPTAPAPSTPAARGTSGATGLGAPASPCERPPYSHIPFTYVMNAALDHLVRWVKDGTLPPTAPPIEVSSAGPPAVIVRDPAGNARGGIRLSQHAVPTAVNTGLNAGPGFCRLNGSHEPFDAATIAGLYPTHASYLSAVRTVTEQNVKAGYLLRADADATIAEAERSGIGGR